jgi:methionyl-tRNA synthetase
LSRARRFVSAQWPYLFDVPALHQCVPMLFGDVMARFYRLRGDDVYFLCGADEHGARVEYVAEGLGLPPTTMVDRALERTRPVLEQLELSFDELGRTGDPGHQSWVKAFFTDLKRLGALEAREVTVAWCEHCARVLPDRFVEGRCPACNGRAFGNQCQDRMVCGRHLKPAQLLGPKCAICADPVSARTRKHWAMKLQPFVASALEGLTSSTAYLEEVRALARRVVDECPEVILTRDFRHGIQIDGPDGQPVCVDGWVDSLLAKVSFTDRAGNTLHFREPSTEKVFFMSRDGLPFYAVLLPALLAASRRGYSLTRWHIQPNQVFVDEGGICTKSTGTGLWLAEALASVPADLWRFYVYFAYAARAEERDVAFRWERFAEVTNSELIAPLETTVQRLAETLASSGVRPWREDAAAREVSKSAANFADEATRLLEQHRTGRALFRLIAGIKAIRDTEATPHLAAAGRDGLRHILPLLGCYLPKVAQRAWQRLGLRGSSAAVRIADGSVVDDPVPSAQGPAVFEHGPIRARDAQREYQRRVDERRRARTLAEEITAARADKLCACPSELTES